MIMPPPTPTKPLNVPAASPIGINKKIVSAFIFASLLCFTKLFFESFFIIGNGILDDLQGGFLILEIIDLHFFIFQHFVLLKKISQLEQKMLGQVFYVFIMIY